MSTVNETTWDTFRKGAKTSTPEELTDLIDRQNLQIAYLESRNMNTVNARRVRAIWMGERRRQTEMAKKTAVFSDKHELLAAGPIARTHLESEYQDVDVYEVSGPHDLECLNVDGRAVWEGRFQIVFAYDSEEIGPVDMLETVWLTTTDFDEDNRTVTVGSTVLDVTA